LSIRSSNISTASAVSHLDNLEFLVDVVPKTVPFKEVKEKKAPAGISKINGESSVEPGQTTLDGMKPAVNGTNGFDHAGPSGTGGDEDPNAQLEMEMEIRGARASIGSSSGYGGKEPSQDVEMH
jgi:DNA polymerase epsilon subunit 4